MPLVIRTKADLLLLKPVGILQPFRKPRLLIRAPKLSESEAHTWELRLQNLQEECGCTGAAVGVGAFVVLFVAYSLQNDLPLAGYPRLRAFVLQGLFLLLASSLAHSSENSRPVYSSGSIPANLPRATRAFAGY